MVLGGRPEGIWAEYGLNTGADARRLSAGPTVAIVSHLFDLKGFLPFEPGGKTSDGTSVTERDQRRQPAEASRLTGSYDRCLDRTGAGAIRGAHKSALSCDIRQPTQRARSR